jgi:hypothetical protein
MKSSISRYCCGLAMAAAMLTSPLRATEPNVLTPDEKAAGWKLLFDGTTTQGWRSFRKHSFPSKGWVAEDGWLKCVPRARGGDIITLDQFENFELQWEWRIPARANSGIKYFITEERRQAIGHEYQMIDDNVFKSPKGQTAAFYDVFAPKPHKPIKLAPEINHSKIVVQGNNVEHWLNDEKVLTYQAGSAEVQAAVAQSKFKEVPGFGSKIRGHILLTEHNDEAWFRNIKIREWPDKQEPETESLAKDRD